MTPSPMRPDPQPFFIQAAAGVAQADQPHASLAALDAALAGAVGHKLFTVLVLNWDRMENQRYYSNLPDAYPVGASKPIVRGSPSMQKIVVEGKCHINHNYADITAAFFDHELIRSLGCESSVNIPVRWNATTIGMLNILHEAGYYTDADIPTLSVFAALAVPALLDIIKAW